MKRVRAFMDSGSERSYLLNSTARELRAQSCGVEQVIHSLFGGQQTAMVAHEKFRVKIQALKGEYEQEVILRGQNKICHGPPRICERVPDLENVLRRRGILLSDSGQISSDVEVLIGADLYGGLLTGKIIHMKCGLVGVETRLGWTLLGEIGSAALNKDMTTGCKIMSLADAMKKNELNGEREVPFEHHDNEWAPAGEIGSSDHYEALAATSTTIPPTEAEFGKKEENVTSVLLTMSTRDMTVSQMWDLEVIGIRDPVDSFNREEREMKILKEFCDEIKINEDGRYSVKLPWRKEHPFLPSNREVAMVRLMSTTKKLKLGNMFEKYGKILEEWETENFIERVPENPTGKRVHYLPHRGVVKNESTTTPLRIVFDASCKVNGISLNDCLYRGENLMQLIFEILVRFREKRVGFVSDVRKAFQMVEVEPEDRDALRFLWWKTPEMGDVVEFRHKRVIFGATCSPFILGAVLNHHLLKEDKSEFGKQLLSTLYVDNCVSSENSVTEYLQFREKSVRMMSEAKMDLRMWLSNVDEFEDPKTHTVSVLGMQWDRWRDELFVKTGNIDSPTKITKRSVLSTIHKVYDPLGIVSPALLAPKLLLQRVWIQKMKWDETLPTNECEIFRKWTSEIKLIETIRIPRVFSASECDRRRWSLHTFTDASKRAYAAAVFMRVEHLGVVTVELICAKSRVTPVKEMTIPRLELVSCLIGARLCASVKSAMKIEGVSEFYWCDSTTAIRWIQKDDLWGTFVGNRTKEIKELTRKETWRYVPGSDNPADLPSRGCSPTTLLRSKWWEGPTWLYLSEDEWPKQDWSFNEEEVNHERSKSRTLERRATLLFFDSMRNQCTFKKLIRVMGWVRRFLRNYYHPTKKMSGPLRMEELERAEFVLIREMQKEDFPTEVRGKMNGLELFEDQWGVLRVKTRLLYSNECETYKYPILLLGKRDEVKQLIRDLHNGYCHAGVSFLCTKIREKYWILKTRQAVRNVILKCAKCRKLKAKPSIPGPAPLPLDRIKDAEVFEVIGVDLAGPMVLKNGAKVWLVIFTCAIFRAVHFELVGAISTRAFLGALEKFIRKYRRPDIIYSDNGTNFRGASNWFRGLDWNKIVEDENVRMIKWKFNPVTASWWGGFWERLIGTAKQLLKRTVGNASLTWRELEVVIDTIGDVMNSRPLTHVSEDVEDLEPLTPFSFLNPLGSTRFPEQELSEGERLRIRYRHVQTVKKELKQRFQKEYVAHLINRNPRKPTRELQVGELVLIGSDGKKRTEWPLGKVVELIVGADGETRLARVKVKDGEYVRAIQRLYPLELDLGDPYVEKIKEDVTVTRSGRRVKAPERYH